MLNPFLILLGLTVAISVYAWSNEELMDSWILHPYGMSRKGQWYRFLTSGFLHADWAHLLFNMFTFYSFGQLVLLYFSEAFGLSGGTWRFLLLYLGGIIISDIPTYFRHKDDPHYRSLGASGGVSSVLFAGVMFQPAAGIFMFPLPVPIPGFIWAFLYLAYSYYQGRRRGDNINHDAHFYGALYGVLITIALYPGVINIFFEGIENYRLFN